MGYKQTPLKDRLRTYYEVRRILESIPGIKPSVLVDQLEETGFRIPSRQTIMRWSREEASPLTNIHVFEPHPSEALSFFLGSWLGDGWGDKSDQGRRMRLKVRSESFANEFAQAATLVLAKPKSYRVWRTKDRRGYWYNVKVTSLLLYEFVTQELRALKSAINLFPLGFIRGFATAEGCPSISISARSGPRLNVGVAISNSDLGLLSFCKALLTHAGINSGRLRRNFTKGHRTNLGVATKDGWLLNISRIDDVERFARIIGFADVEKQYKLDTGLRLLRESGPIAGARLWIESFRKSERKWVRRG